MKTHCFLAGGLAVAIMGGASAQVSDSRDPAFQKLMAMPGMQAIIMNAVRHVPGERFGVCHGPFKLSDIKFAIEKPLTFEAAGAPISGQWVMRASTDVCSTVLNIYFTALGKGDIQFDVGLSGETKADLQLQLDTIAAVEKALGKRVPDCKLFGAVGARWGGFGLPGKPEPDPGPNAVNHTWWETWSMLACTRLYEVPVGFKAVPGDTTYMVFEPKATDQVIPPGTKP